MQRLVSVFSGLVGFPNAKLRGREMIIERLMINLKSSILISRSKAIRLFPVPIKRDAIQKFSSRFQHEIHMHGIEGEFDLALLGFLQYSGIQKHVNISMYSFYVPAQSTRSLTN